METYCKSDVGSKHIALLKSAFLGQESIILPKLREDFRESEGGRVGERELRVKEGWTNMIHAQCMHDIWKYQ